MSMAEVPHVPAWKRLGLKLKNQPASNEAADSPASIQQSTPVSKPQKRKATDISGASNVSHDKSNLSPSRSEATPSKADRPLKRRKSVAFADGTKDDDGDSNEKLLEDYVAEQDGGENQFSKSEVAQFTAPSKVHPANEPSLKTNGASKEVKKEKKKKDRSSKTEANDELRQDPTYILYLKEYRSARATWKFNKAKQNKLLDNLYNTWRVPFDLDDALSSYISGLQGEATRKRLVEDANKIVSETKDLEGEIVNMSGQPDLAAAKKKALMAQLKQTKSHIRNQQAAEDARSDEHQEKLRKRKRALLILQSLKSYPSPSSGDEREIAKQPVQEADPPAKRRKTRRSRKMRTGLPDDDDTDETSSASSVPDTATSESEDDSGSDQSSEVSSDSEDGSSSGSSSGSSDGSDSDSDSE